MDHHLTQCQIATFILTGNGYCRSEAVVMVFLQKSADAKRIYATVVHSGNNADGNKEQGKICLFLI